MGISRRAYAARRGISESAVRKHIASGVLAGAVEPDGTLNPTKADALLARSLTRQKPERQPVVLRTAQQRKNRALAVKQAAELDDLRVSVIARERVAASIAQLVEPMAAIYGTWPGHVAPMVAGRSPEEAHRVISREVNNLFGRVQAEYPRPQPEPPYVDPNFDSLGPVALKALLLNQAAERIEIEHGVERGELLWIEKLLLLWCEKLAISKSLLTSISGRVAPYAPSASVAEMEQLLAGEIERSLAVLNFNEKEFPR